MASLDTSMIRQELRSIEGTSKGVSKQLFRELERLEKDPSQFPELDYVDPSIAQSYPTVTLRKVKIEPGGKHSYRIIVAHWDRGDYEDHVDGLYAFPRQDGYPIDWDEVHDWLGDL